jgi:RNA polymerase sigma-70 factor, ECF subfamily
MNSLNDISLVKQVAVFHNKQAFGRLVVKYQSPIRRFFLHQTAGDEALSDDLAQETFIKAYTNIAKFRGTAAFSSWLYRIACNVFYDHVRRQRPTIDIDSGEAMHVGASSGECGLNMDICRAMRCLSDKERTCITLQLVDGYPIDEIAKITEMTEGTVKSHLFRGKQKLTEYLKKNGYDRKRK